MKKHRKESKNNFRRYSLFCVFTFSFYFFTFTFSLLSASCADFADVLGGTIKSSRQKVPPPPPVEEPEESFPKEEMPPVPPQVERKVEDKGPLKFSWPVDGPVTSLFGKRRGRAHDGIDVSAPRGTPIRAARQGVVIYAGRLSGYGNLVIVKHESNYYTAYAHMAAIKTGRDKRVKQGQTVGLAGKTGRSRGSHLHFEIRHETKPVNPLTLLPPNRFGVRQGEGGEE